ncbi:MAG: alpha amylase C-terminal domain-containing protein [Desulfarculus sp.]|nr:alpha amylase C-terminal domain-containing protein [Desulfarculus sp.]
MAMVIFNFFTGLRPRLFNNVRLMGSWDAGGGYSNLWSTTPMEEFTAEDGCPAWSATVALDDGQIGWGFQWGVVLDGILRNHVWGIATEVPEAYSTAQHRSFTLTGNGQVENYWFTHARRLGANKRYRPGSQTPTACFSVWAPNARKVQLAVGDLKSGYIWPDGRGVKELFAMTRDSHGIWSTDPDDPGLADFAVWDHKKPYMFAIERDDGNLVFRTDLHSRCQIGSGSKNPESPRPDPNYPGQTTGTAWNGTPQDLDGSKSCSMVVDTEKVTKHFKEPNFPENEWVSLEEFWANEFDSLRPLPTRVEDLVIYELHVGSLGFGRPDGGNLEDALAFLDHLEELGVNAVELMPMAEYDGALAWGYGSSHYYAIEYASGGRDQLKFFVRECHRRGIAVILDVVYNHFTADAERAEWMYDSTANENNIYYWYQGRPSDWPGDNPPGHGGYLDNGSTGYCPNFREEMVRKMLIGSAAMLVTEFHIDGFRVDLTQAIHRDNVIHANGQACAEANAFGAKFLREWARTLKLVKPGVVLIAEDHTGWGAMTQPQETGGIGFNAVWWADWYHNLIGDATNDGGKARLLHGCGYGGDGPLNMDGMAGALAGTPHKVIYHESHDEAGNSSYQENGRQVHSARTMQVAVNGCLSDGNRAWAAARSRVAAGLTFLAAGIPMFFMGEEVGAAKPFMHDSFINCRENLAGLKAGEGKEQFRYYQDIIRVWRGAPALRSTNIEVVHVHNANRVLAFRRWWGNDEFVVLASLANHPYLGGYTISHPALGNKSWTELMSSDADIYGGTGVCNQGSIVSSGGGLSVRLPANGLLVMQRLG